MSEPEITDCPDCGVEPDQPHESDGCDVARCLVTGFQRLGCGEEHDCGQEVWTGEWPGVAECREFGWWSVFVPNGRPSSWRQVPAGTPEAVEDLNRLVIEGVWDREAKRWRKP